MLYTQRHIHRWREKNTPQIKTYVRMVWIVVIINLIWTNEKPAMERYVARSTNSKSMVRKGENKNKTHRTSLWNRLRFFWKNVGFAFKWVFHIYPRSLEEIQDRNIVGKLMRFGQLNFGVYIDSIASFAITFNFGYRKKRSVCPTKSVSDDSTAKSFESGENDGEKSEFGFSYRTKWDVSSTIHFRSSVIEKEWKNESESERERWEREREDGGR